MTYFFSKYDKPVEVGVWTPIFKGDGLVNLGAKDTLAFPAATPAVPYVVGVLYVNVSGSLIDGNRDGVYDIRAVRVGTTNDTAVKDYPVVSEAESRWFQSYCHHAPWIGKNPKGLRWEIRPRINIATCQIATRYAKHVGLPVVF